MEARVGMGRWIPFLVLRVSTSIGTSAPLWEPNLTQAQAPSLEPHPNPNPNPNLSLSPNPHSCPSPHLNPNPELQPTPSWNLLKPPSLHALRTLTLSVSGLDLPWLTAQRFSRFVG